MCYKGTTQGKVLGRCRIVTLKKIVEHNLKIQVSSSAMRKFKNKIEDNNLEVKF